MASRVNNNAAQFDAEFDGLLSPLKSPSELIETDQETLLQEESEIYAGTEFKKWGRIPQRRGIQVLKVGELKIIAIKTTPVLFINNSAHFSCFLAMPLCGGFTCQNGTVSEEVRPGDIYFNQNHSGTSTTGYLSSLFFGLDRKRLNRTMQLASGSETCKLLASSVIVRGNSETSRLIGSQKLWSLIDYIDRLHSVHPFMPTYFDLDEQFYRLLALALLEADGKLETIHQHWSKACDARKDPLENLVHYIQSHTHLNLTLADLEDISHYSARHLQILFKEKLGCTPMQFVRRQKLARAMEKLRSADWDDSVATVARDCGFRNTSTFSSDFIREFDVKPSVILRSSRTRQK